MNLLASGTGIACRTETKTDSMKIVDIKVMRGANYWSNYRKQIIVMKLDIGKLENFPTNRLDGFAERIEKMIPSLHSHRCSEGYEGGFFHRVRIGTWMGHVIEHIALEIQTIAGMETGYGRTRSTKERGVYHVVFSYTLEKAGIYAAKAAVRIAEALVKKEPYDIDADIEELKYINSRYGYGPSTGSIVAEAEKRNIPVRRMNESSLVTFGHGSKQRKIRATMTGATSSMAVDIAGDKDDTKKLLEKAHIPVPKGILITQETELFEALEEIQFPLVIKPADGNHGRGITTNISNAEDAIRAFQVAKTISKYVIVEEFISGFDYRFLVINYKLVAVAKRTPALIIGDGLSTIQELIDQTNNDPARGDGHQNVMTKITVDEITRQILAQRNLTLNSILTMGQILVLKDTANISTGGTSRDVTDLVHPDTKFMAERIARLVGLDICGIDIVAKDINVPLTKNIGGIVEVNACPGLRMHLSPAKGMGRNVAEPIVDMLFPKNDNGRIPIIAISGTNGKTTTTRLIAHMVKQAGHNVGYTTSDGIYIQDQMIAKGDCTGPSSAETILTDPTVDFAVLETARGGILRSGLGFDECNISIVTNVTEDHLGLKDINTLEELAKVKAVVARSTARDGYAILNADDELVYKMRRDVDSNVALFSIEENNPKILSHIENGGMAAIIENGYLVICKGNWKTRIEKIVNIPLSMNGKAECMIKNILPSTLAAVIQGFELEDIREALKTFIPSAAQTPGRMNMFHFNHFDVMIDYAHNTDGFIQLKKFLADTQASVKVGILSATGDRRDEDIRNFGKIAAQMFDEIILKHDEDLRGRTKEEIIQLLTEGIYSEREMPIKVISNEIEAIQYALDHAVKDAFITICADKIGSTIQYISEAQVKEKQGFRTTHDISLLQKFNSPDQPSDQP